MTSLRPPFEAEESKDNGCSGWSMECPHEGIFHKGSKACKACNQEAMDAWDEVNNDR